MTFVKKLGQYFKDLPASLKLTVNHYFPVYSPEGDKDVRVSGETLLKFITDNLSISSGIKQVFELTGVGGANNDYTSSLSITSYQTEGLYIFKPSFDSDNTTTLNINSLGILPIKEFNGTSLINKTDVKSVNTYVLLNKVSYWLVIGGINGGSVGSGNTNLTQTITPTVITIHSDTGTDATIPLADETNAGLLKPSKYTVLENTSNTNTGDETATTIGALLTDDTTPLDTDQVVSWDGTYLLKTTWTNIKAFFKTYFDGLYHPKGLIEDKNIYFSNGAVLCKMYFRVATTITFVTKSASINTVSYSTNNGSSYILLSSGSVSISLSAGTSIWFSITYVTPTTTSDGTITFSVQQTL